MRLFPRLAMLLACVPLLFPPGLCACGAEVVAPPQPVKAVNVAPRPTPAKRCGCGHTAKHATTVTNSVATAPPEHEHRVPHAPSCPAVSAIERAPWVERAEPVDHVTAVAFVCSVTSTFAVAEPGKQAVPRAVPDYAARPRYLTHCALLF